MKKKRLKKVISALTAVACAVSSFTLSVAVSAKSTDTEKTSANTSAATVNANDPGKFSWDNATVYFLLTDRFKNGNTSNDHSYNRGLDENGSVVNISDTRGTFHGGDFAGITQKINEGYFDDLGVNAIWLSAPYEQIHGYIVGSDGSPSFAHYSYHGYYVLDYTQTDKNFGTEQEFQTLVDTAHKHGIRIVMDIVMNHSGYNSVYDMAEYGFGTVKSGWEADYYSHQNVNNKTYHSYIDYDASASDWANWWGTDWIRCGVAGYTEGGGSPLVQCLLGLPDFKTESSKTVDIPKILQTKWSKEGVLSQKTSETQSLLGGKPMTVTNTISGWLSSWVKKYGVDGFRCDTAKHVEYASWKVLKETCVNALKEWRASNPGKAGANWTDDFWMTGECWDHGMYKDDYYTSGGFDSMINFNTQGGGLVAQGTVAGVYQGYADAINTDPTFNVLSYMSSHDSVLARDDMINRGSAFLLLPGAVQIFYGDETNRPLVEGMSFDGNGGAGHSLRSDMNWNNMDENMLEHWQTVGQFRNNHIAVGAGDNTGVKSTAGVAFTREYNKNGTTDKIAACIYAGSGNDVTIDVSNIWEDGHDVMNAYDGSSYTVSDGKVTFNSGNNGTILIQEPDGKPIVSLKGESQFVGTQTITVALKETNSAILSIDGGHKFTVKDGDKFTIGETAYDGDKIKINIQAENDKGVMNKTTVFTKISKTAYDDSHTEKPVIEVDSVVYVKAPDDGSVPSLYAWIDENTKLTGQWPGKKMELDPETSMYKMELDTNSPYNAIVNKDGGLQSGDLTGLYGKTVISAKNYSNASVDSTETKPGTGGSTEAAETVIKVKMENGSAPYLYVWDDKKNTYNGAWPGGQLTEKDEDGYYVFTAKASKVNCIVNTGSNQGQTGNIEGLSGTVILDVSSSLGVKKTVIEQPVSKFGLLKQETRSIKEMYSYEYTEQSFSSLKALVPQAEVIIAKGEADATEDEILTMISNITMAKKNLVLAAPVITNVSVGTTQIKGTSVLGSKVQVKVNSSIYSANADEFTGIWSVVVPAVSSSDKITATCTKDSLTSATATYSMSDGTLNTTPEIPKSPVDIYNGGSSPTPPDKNTYLYGDVNLDGEVSVKDATIIQKYIAGKASLNAIQLKAAMVNTSNEVDITDATAIQKYLAGKIKTFANGTSFKA